jgi:hypothetical protein
LVLQDFHVYLDKNNADLNSQDRSAHRLSDADQDLETEYDGQEQTLYHRAYFVHDPENRSDIDNIAMKFWEIENIKTKGENLILNTEERQALNSQGRSAHRLSDADQDLETEFL